MDDKAGKVFNINCGSKYFETKYRGSPVFVIEKATTMEFSPPTFLYQGRVLAEGKPELLHGTIYYGHVCGLGEFVHESELGEEVV